MCICIADAWIAIAIKINKKKQEKEEKGNRKKVLIEVKSSIKWTIHQVICVVC